jgi:hypothetical protein
MYVIIGYDQLPNIKALGPSKSSFDLLSFPHIKPPEFPKPSVYD